jgi:DNA-directed RNA polymerase specialized sigma24 family protein
MPPSPGGFCSECSAPPRTSKDALQDVFLRLFRDLASLREPSALRSFLIGIALHVATSELRRRRARRWLMLSDDGKLPRSASRRGS